MDASTRPTRPWRRRLKRAALALLALTAVCAALIWASTDFGAALGSAPSDADLKRYASSPQRQGDRFVNSVDTPMGGWDWERAESVISRYNAPNSDPAPSGDIPVVASATPWPDAPSRDVRVTWLLHSTVLVEIDGYRVLTDPVWSERCSPSPWIGPRRFHPAPVALDQLPKIDAIVISHDHYDHLDYATVTHFAAQDVPFFVPLGVGAHLRGWGVPDANITELDWWGEATVTRPNTPALHLVATPARHFSGRNVNDRFRTLWASWAILGPKHKVYFGGDTGYFDGFTTIRKRLGPFDINLLPVGAYDPAWDAIHLNPEQALQAHKDLGGGMMIPIHWASFALAPHDWSAPPRRLMGAFDPNPTQRLHFPRVGEPVTLSTWRRQGTPTNDAWWRKTDP